MMRVTKATTFSASMSSTNHITIVGVNMLIPSGLQPCWHQVSRGAQLPVSLDTSVIDGFLSGYLRYQCSIPHGEECHRLKRTNGCVTSSVCSAPNRARNSILKTVLPDNTIRGLPTRKNGSAGGASQGPQELRQKWCKILYFPFANQPMESLAWSLCVPKCPALGCAR